MTSRSVPVFGTSLTPSLCGNVGGGTFSTSRGSLGGVPHITRDALCTAGGIRTGQAVSGAILALGVAQVPPVTQTCALTFRTCVAGQGRADFAT